MQSYPHFMELLNDTWIKRFGLNTTREHDLDDALFGYDTMWLAALAMDMAETRLQNMTPSLTLGDFKYTGKNSSMIKDAIYNSGLEVSFTGASVSVNTCTLLLLHNTFIWTIAYHTTIHMSDKNSFLHAYYRAPSSSSPMETELQSYDISSIGLIVKVKVITFFYWYHNRPSS